MTTSWREKYKQAKFRGVDFFVERTDTAGGRRLERHEFPKRDEPFVEDMGRRARAFSVDAYVLGDDYFDRRDALIEAAEKEGSGLLVHPYFGTLRVLCQTYRVSESNRDGRMCRISLAFEEAGSLAFPGTVVDTPAALNTKKISGLKSVFDNFLDVYSTVRQQYAKVQNAVATVEAGFNLIETAKRIAASDSGFTRQVAGLVGRAAELVNNPTSLITELQSLLTFGTFPDIGDIRATNTNSLEQFAEQRTLFDFEPDDPGSEDDPADVFAASLRWSAVVTSGGLIGTIVFDTYESAVEARDVVLDQVDTIIESGIAVDDLRVSLRELRAAVVADVRIRSATLPRLTEMTLPNTLPAVVLSNQLYGNIERERDLVDRNSVDHPGFMPAGRPIQVLVDVE